MAAEGLSTRAIARDLGTMPRTVSHWRIRFAEEGLSGLDDRPRPGGRASAKYDETTDRRILAVLGRPPPEGYARWTGGLVAEALDDVSDQYVWRFLRAQKIDLDGRKSWCAARAAELLTLSPDVIVASNSQAVAAAKAQTASIPIVMIDVSHPVEAGFIRSLAQPGSNVTGVTNQSKNIAMKHYELLREISPAVQRVALVFTPSNAGSKLGLEEQTLVASALGIDVIPVPFEGPADVGEATVILKRARAQALQVHTTPVTIVHRAMIAELAMEHDLPTISFNEAMARAGILMTYGANRTESWRRAADYVDRLLRGEKASELPVEQPTRFDLHINLKTAVALRLAMPPTLLARADEVIE